MSRRGWLLFIAMGVIWGLPYLFIKVAVEDLSPASLVFLRTTAAALLLVPMATLRGQLRVLLPRWRPLLAYTAVEMAIPWFLLANAERRLTSSLASLLLATVPLFGAMLGWFTRTDRLNWRRGLGLLIGSAGWPPSSGWIWAGATSLPCAKWQSLRSGTRAVPLFSTGAFRIFQLWAWSPVLSC